GSADTWISVFHKTNNFGGIADIKDKDGWYNMLVRFPVFQSEGGPVPDGATIESATLSLYKTSSYDHVYTATRILKAWQETAVSWNNRLPGTAWSVAGAAGIGTDIATAPDGQGSVGFAPQQWLNIDVTSGIQAMSTGAANHGWLIDGLSGYNNIRHFNSREVANAGLRPKLSIRYSVN
ncbi:MAG TPA: DNRLRE domain-containing protein, partial [Chromatiaceae bacterium]|nr:DNRLRE domain-containing protein [Chromatiaceae bacterium]